MQILRILKKKCKDKVINSTFFTKDMNDILSDVASVETSSLIKHQLINAYSPVYSITELVASQQEDMQLLEDIGYVYESILSTNFSDKKFKEAINSVFNSKQVVEAFAHEKLGLDKEIIQDSYALFNSAHKRHILNQRSRYIDEDIQLLEKDLSTIGFYTQELISARMDYEVGDAIEAMFHNSFQHARKAGISDLEFHVSMSVPASKRHLVITTRDNAGGFSDENIYFTPPSSREGGIGLGAAFSHVRNSQGVYLRATDENGAYQELTYPLREVQGELEQRYHTPW